MKGGLLCKWLHISGEGKSMKDHTKGGTCKSFERVNTTRWYLLLKNKPGNLEIRVGLGEGSNTVKIVVCPKWRVAGDLHLQCNKLCLFNQLLIAYSGNKLMQGELVMSSVQPITSFYMWMLVLLTCPKDDSLEIIMLKQITGKEMERRSRGPHPGLRGGSGVVLLLIC